jgi:hypothetical protein
VGTPRSHGEEVYRFESAEARFRTQVVLGMQDDKA